MNLIFFTVVCCNVALATDRNSTVGPLNGTANTNASTVSTPLLDDTTSTETTDSNFTTEMTMTTCDANCSVSTEAPTLNATTSGPKNSTKSDAAPKSTETKTFRRKEFCICDLQVNFCDINCCCDADCSPDDRQVFRQCESENLYYDTRYCDYMKYIYINNTPFEWHVNQNGLFCVVQDNLPPSYPLQRKQPLASYANAKLEKNKKFTWSNPSGGHEVVFNSTEKFSHGSNIWLMRENGINKFRLPKKFLTNACMIQEDVRNLINVQNTCTQTDIAEDNTALNFGNYFQNIYIVAAPNLLNVSKYKNVFQECPRNICLSISPKICDEHFYTCENISKNDTRLKVSCDYNIIRNKNNCMNVVKKLQYNFYHNGAKGYNRIELLGVLDNVTYEFGTEDFGFPQEFTVNFWWTNQTRNYSAMLSGNPGYLIGKPILIGNMINVGNKTKNVLKIDRFSDNYLRNFMSLPENVNGNCALNNKHYLTIEFGYNLLTKCKFSGIEFNKRTYLNGTEICRNIQRNVLKLWGVGAANKTVAMFGNANANHPEEWTKILYNVSPGSVINGTMGRFGDSNNSITCFGIVTRLIVDVYHSKISFKSLLNQEKILGVTYSFDSLVNKTFTYFKQKNSTYFEFDLESQVVFYDISVRKKTKFVDAPSLEIKLPYDFFYPFIKVENEAEKFTSNYILWTCMYLLLAFNR